MRYLGPIIWDMVSIDIRNCGSLNNFKKYTKSWEPIEYPCRFYKRYIAQAGLMKSTLPLPLHKKWSFLLWISSVRVTKSTVSNGIGIDKPYL